MKSGVRLEHVNLVMQTLPLVVLQGLMEDGEACIDNLVMLTEKNHAWESNGRRFQLARRRQESIL